MQLKMKTLTVTLNLFQGLILTWDTEIIPIIIKDGMTQHVNFREFRD